MREIKYLKNTMNILYLSIFLAQGKHWNQYILVYSHLTELFKKGSYWSEASGYLRPMPLCHCVVTDIDAQP